MKLTSTVITEYEKFLKDIPRYIELSGKKKMHVAEKAGINYKTFSRKIKTRSFTPQEAKSIVEALNNVL